MFRTGFNFLDASNCGNKNLQIICHLMGGGGKSGSGIDKISAGPKLQRAAGLEGCPGTYAQVVAGGGFRVSQLFHKIRE